MARLTLKQREVLDLLLDHKTSKEIAQVLRISPHTVDQRIQFAKKQLGARTRSDLARLYRQHRDVYNQPLYEKSRISLLADLPHQSEWDEVQSRHEQAPDQPGAAMVESGRDIVPELFLGVRGRGVRLIAIMVIALLTMLLALGGLAIYSSLAELLAG